MITVAPQNDICLHGKTYLKNADLITKSKSVIPLDHKWDLEYDLKYILRQIWMKIKAKNILALLAWINRIIQPKFTLIWMYKTE